MPKMWREKDENKNTKAHISIQAFQSDFIYILFQLYYEGPVKISDKKMDPKRSYDFRLSAFISLV